MGGWQQTYKFASVLHLAVHLREATVGLKLLLSAHHEGLGLLDFALGLLLWLCNFEVCHLVGERVEVFWYLVKNDFRELSLDKAAMCVSLDRSCFPQFKKKTYFEGAMVSE